MLLFQTSLNYLAKRSMCKMTSPALVVYIDGCCLHNGGDVGLRQAGIGVFWGTQHPWNLSEPLRSKVKTNSRAEVTAAIRALETVTEQHGQQKENETILNVIVRSDSQFLILSMTRWLPIWRANNWRKANGSPVVLKKELTYLAQLERRYGDGRILWEHVPRDQNKDANRLANLGAIMDTAVFDQSINISEDS